MKASMSSQKIPFWDRLLSSWNILQAYRSGVFGNVDSDISFHQHLSEIIKQNLKKNIENLKILDIGCGQKATQVAMFKADGADVVGIDMETVTCRINISTFISMMKTNGIERAVKSFIRHVLFDKKFTSNLSTKYGKTISYDKLNVHVMNATKLSFPDNSFDLIYSKWAFEHVDDIPAAIREVNRVLHPEGIAYIGIHLFPSLSGGHHLDWINPEKTVSTVVPPWDHCLDNKYPVNTFLNKLRLNQYRDYFSKHLNVMDEQLTQEGEKLLDSATEERLVEKGFTRIDLLTRTVTFLCKKK